MAKLWEPNPDYTKRAPITLEDWRDFSRKPEQYFPYKRLYDTLNHSQLSELIRDAYWNHWEALDLRDCGLDALPEELGDLPELRFLALGNRREKRGKGNLFPELPACIGGLKRLQSLDLLEAKIKTLPESIGDLSRLRSIIMEDTEISALPESIGRLSNLQLLHLNHTLITILPESIGQLSNLQELYLYGTPITALPEFIGQLSNLQKLDLGGTQITALLESIGQLYNLQLLYLDRTLITILPESISQLSNLQILSLRNSKITALPESIGQLSNLKTLDLNACRLQSIPYGVVKLGLPFVTNNMSAENCVNLTGVTLDEGELSLFDQPREVIEEYYRNRMTETEADKRVNECKVIFLGDGAAGKSSLIERMMYDRFQPGTLPTDGIKMTKWSAYANGKPLTLDGRPLTIRFLDFGGQEIMHSMHRCFLTAHTIYVVVCESRDDGEIDGVAARWMETVKSFAPDCPVLLALNKADLNPHVTVNERTLKDRNPQYRHLLRTSAKTGRGVQQLIEDILEEVPDCLRKMNGNRGWLGLKQELEDMEEDYILPDKFRERCDYFHIREDLRAGALNWFQDLGVAYAYSTTFRDMYVLNPAWLTNGIYRLILRTPGGGFLKHSVIRETLARPHPGDMSDKTYTGLEMEFILHIMRKFEISLNIPPAFGDGDETEMVPMKLDKTPPERYDDFPKSGALHLRWEAGYLPNNLVHRLMIRKYAELDPRMEPEKKCVWRTGGWFQSMDGGGEALAEMTDKAMDVYVRGGERPQLYMDSFRREILQILGKLGIKAQEWIYCTVKGKTGRIPYKHVMNIYRRREERIYLGDIDEYVPIENILQTNYVYAGERPRDFFISYNNGRNGERAAWIAKTLRENGYTVHFQADDCKPSMNFVQWMAEAISNSLGFLAVWSGAYEDSQYCKDELNAAYVRTHTDKRFLLLPVRAEDVKIQNPLFAGVVYADVFASDEEKNRKELLKAAEQIRQRR